MRHAGGKPAQLIFMKSNPNANESAPKSANPARKSGADRPDRRAGERAQHGDALKKRELRPGEVGLANEARPGLGTRGDESRAKPQKDLPLDSGAPRAPEAAKTHRSPRPAPQEPADALTQEQERSTGISGQSGGT
jgi:hypothetical protein